MASFEEVINHLGGNELKCAVLAFGFDSDYSISKQIVKHLNNLLPKGTWFSPHASNIRNYCIEDFIPLGYIEEILSYSRSEAQDLIGDEFIINGGKPPYKLVSLTNKGINEGVPIAKFLLHKSFELGYSTHAVFGLSSGSNNKRCNTNVLILEDLINNKKLAQQFRKALNNEFTSQLVNIGFIEYDSIGELTPWSKYEIVKGAEYQSNINLKKKIFDLLKSSNVPLGWKEVGNLLGFLPQTVSSRLRELEDDGLIKQVSGFKNNICKCKASVTPKGVNFYNTVVIPLKEFLNGNRKLLEDTLTDDDTLIKEASFALNYYSNVCPNLKRVSFDERRKSIIDHIKANGPTRRNELISALSNKGIDAKLKQLINDGILTKKIEGPKVYYELKG